MALTIRNIQFTQQNIGGIANALNGQTRSQVAEAYRQVLGMDTIAFYPGHYHTPLENRIRDISAVFGVIAVGAIVFGLVACAIASTSYGGAWGLACTITAIVFSSIAGGSLIGLTGNEIRRHIYWSQPEHNSQGRLTTLMQNALRTWDYNYHLDRDRNINFPDFERAISSYYGEQRCNQGTATRNALLIANHRAP